MTTEPLARLVRTMRAALDTESLSDADLLGRLRRSRDSAAAEAIVQRHGPRVLAACRRVLGQSAEAEDAFQATFLVLLRNPAAIRDRAALGAWLSGVAHRIAVRARDRAKRPPPRLADRPAAPDLSWTEACAILHAELDRLPDGYRLPLILCYLEGLSRDEAAARLGRSLNSVKKALEAGRARLRKRLVRRGVTLSAGLLAAAAGPTVDGSTADVLPRVGDPVRPAAAALASEMRTASRLRWAGVGLAASVVAVGVALGFRGLPKKDPPKGNAAPAASVAKADVPDPGPQGNQIVFAGRVVEPDGKPAVGARVFLIGMVEMHGQPPTIKSLATTGADGRFRVAAERKPLAGYPPTLVAAADGFGLGLVRANKDGTADAEVRLFIDQPIKGRIVDLQGKPVAGAAVCVVQLCSEPTADLSAWLRQAEGPGLKLGLENVFDKLPVNVSLRHRSLPELVPATTDADGRFTLSGVGRERLVALSITGRGAAASEVIVVIQPGPAGQFKLVVSGNETIRRPFYRLPFDHVVTPDQPLEGRVTDLESGEPIAGVTVETSSTKFGRIEAVTDRDGHYRFAGLPPGVHFFNLEPAPDTPYHVRNTLGGERDSIRSTRMDVKLRRAPWVRGTVVDERTRQPIAGAWVRYYPDRNNPRTKDYLPNGRVIDVLATSGPDGTFRLPGIPGRGWVNVGHDGGYVPAVERHLQGDTTEQAVPDAIPTTIVGWATGGNALVAVDVDPKAPKEYTVTLDPGVKVPVTFADPDGKPVTGAVVLGVESAWPKWSKPLAGDTVELRGYNPDHPRPVLAFHPGRELGRLLEPKKGETGPRTLKLQPTATVTGRLVLPDGKPYPNADLSLSIGYPGWSGPTWPPDGLPEARTRTDGDGRFRFTKVIGDVDYHVGYRVFGDKHGTSTAIPFRAKPGEIKDLGVVKTQAPRE